MEIALVAAIMIGIVLFQVPRLLREKYYGELLGFALMWFVAVVYALLVALDVPLPTVIDVLDFAYTRIPFLKSVY